MIIDMIEYSEIMDYLDDLTDTGNLTMAQCIADEFGLSIEMAEKLVKEWYLIQWFEEENESV